jgi:hypothetical protein
LRNKAGKADAWIRIIAEAGVEINGSDRVTTWRKEPDFNHPVYSIEKPFPLPGYKSSQKSLIYRLEQVFVNGSLLRQAVEKGMLKPKDIFWVDDLNKKLYVCLRGGRNPNQETTEVTHRSWAIAIGAKPNQNYWHDASSQALNRAAYIRISGFKVRNIGNFSRMGAIQVRGTCHDIIVENCDVQWVNHEGLSMKSLRVFSKKSIVGCGRR